MADTGKCYITRHGSPELDEDAAKLRALGADPGAELDDIDGWIECWNCGGEGWVEDDDPEWQANEKCEICEGRGGWQHIEERL